MKQILSAVVYCHNNKIVHRDIKPENLLYESKQDNSTIKVIDWGTAAEFEPTQKMTKKQGTPYYIAPEVIKRRYNEKCDVWSCGVILYIMMCGYPPFNGKSNQEIMAKILKGSFTFPEKDWGHISHKCKM